MYGAAASCAKSSLRGGTTRTLAGRPKSAGGKKRFVLGSDLLELSVGFARGCRKGCSGQLVLGYAENSLDPLGGD